VKRVLRAILVVGVSAVGGVPAAHAGGATDAALGLGAFAVFNQLVRGETIFHGIFGPPPVVVAPPVAVAPVVVAPPPPVAYYPPAPVYYAPRPVGPVYYRAVPRAYYRAAPPRHYYKAVPRGHGKKAHGPWEGHHRRH
jgi:hypothetical protein